LLSMGSSGVVRKGKKKRRFSTANVVSGTDEVRKERQTSRTSKRRGRGQRT